MAQSSDAKPDDGAVEPLNLQQRRGRGFCTCPLKIPDVSTTSPDSEPCRVHPKSIGYSANHDQSHGRLFFDESRNRYVSWEDAVEGMRQPRYTAASSRGLVLFTWVNLVHLLEALRHPTQEPPVEITERSAEELIKWAGENFPPDVLRSLMAFARGGQTEALGKIFRTVARNAQRDRAPAKSSPHGIGT